MTNVVVRVCSHASPPPLVQSHMVGVSCPVVQDVPLPPPPPLYRGIRRKGYLPSIYIPFRLIRTIYSGRQDGGGMGQPSGFCCTFMICHSLHIARTYSPLIQSLSTAARTSLIVSNPLLISERIRFPEFIRI